MSMSPVTARPRWGTFSVISHQDARALTVDVLLYDRLIFPTPTRDSIRNWPVEWNAEWQEHRLEQLRGLVHWWGWDGQVRDEWRRRWQDIKEIADVVENPEYNLTMQVLAEAAQQEVENSPSAPVIMAAYQSKETAFRDYEVTPDTAADRQVGDDAQEDLQRRVAALFETRLLIPDDDDAEECLSRAIQLARDPSYQQARRSLYAWQDDIMAKGWSPDQAIALFEERLDRHNELVQQHARQVVARRIWRIASFVGASTVGLLTDNPLLSLGANGAVEVVNARFPSLTGSSHDPNTRPEATLTRAISAVCHD
jgi:hypothetical protein